MVPNPFQPRREFDEQKLRELADSVRMYGILQPLTVTRKEVAREDGTFYTEYELIAGERRLRASKLAGLSQVPVIIREGDDSEQEKLELAIIENLQREDLNAIDRALAFRQLAEIFGLSHTQVSRKVGRSREYVSNSIRLLGLPDYMQTALRQGEMSEGHARTLLMLNDRPEEQDVVYREILLKKLSVREVERIVRKIATDKVRKKNPMEFDNELIEMEKQFMETLGTRVQIQKTDYGGQLTIDYFSVVDLESMLSRIRTSHLNEAATTSTQEERAKLALHTPLENIETAANEFASPVDASPVDDSSVELMGVPDQSILQPFPPTVALANPSVQTVSNYTPIPVPAVIAVPAVAAYSVAEAVFRVESVASQSHESTATSVDVAEIDTWPTPPKPPMPPVPLAPPMTALTQSDFTAPPAAVEDFAEQIPVEVEALPAEVPAAFPVVATRVEQTVDQSVPSAPLYNPDRPEPEVLPTPPAVPVIPDKDDSSLYSIKNFGI